MNLHVGTSGYAYKEWKGKFYPKDLPPSQMLHYYGGHFGAVEINNTFYKMPLPSVFEAWMAEVPKDFLFAIKSPQRITHMQRLKNSAESVKELLDAVAVLKKQLAPLLFQLPPNFKKDLPRLREFLGLLPPGCRAAFEFRHQSWFEDDLFDLLREHRAALCIANDDDDLKIPFVATTDWGYLRLRRLDYSAAKLKTWVKQVQAQNWRDAFVFFKHEDTGTGPKFAKKFIDFALNQPS